MYTVQIIGTEAQAAVQELLELPGVTGTVVQSEEKVRDFGAAVEIIENLIGIAGGLVMLYDWYQKWRQAHHEARFL
ncbi:hypothetical protein [Candidatus Cyanaurora vandensis]|uniref:hypothetical protein n=1 Tax=Candidatus Cyanaurora vandensis TaxID=2714958 RepID=UPI00257A8338|nr:hypothetical protein [Candidatus Cyanaurora vandensis]